MMQLNSSIKYILFFEMLVLDVYLNILCIYIYIGNHSHANIETYRMATRVILCLYNS